jgi:hypothetical protein
MLQGCMQWAYSSVVERSTADRQVSSSNLDAPWVRRDFGLFVKNPFLFFGSVFVRSCTLVGPTICAVERLTVSMRLRGPSSRASVSGLIDLAIHCALPYILTCFICKIDKDGLSNLKISSFNFWVNVCFSEIRIAGKFKFITIIW